MTRLLRDVPAHVQPLLDALGDALAGRGPAVRPVPAAAGSGDDVRVGDGVAAVVDTSGSTGEPRGVLLGADALMASADATYRRLGGPGRWLLALPLHHVAGLQVLVRSVVAGTVPTVLPSGRFRPASFRDAVAAMPREGRRYTSLVPTQLVRVLQDDAATAALATFDAVLLGGAATPPDLRERAVAAGVRVVTTYGMTETCGGCVYDGVPLDGVRVSLDADDRVQLGGPVLADGYLGRPDLDASAFAATPSGRLLRTNDLGRIDDGVLTVLGRADDVVVTGGVKVVPTLVEQAVAALDDVAEVCVVGVPDAEWGQAVVAVVVPREGRPAPTLAQVRALVADRVGAAAAPRRVVSVSRLPLRGPGKVDRRAVAALVPADRPAPPILPVAPVLPASPVRPVPPVPAVQHPGAHQPPDDRGASPTTGGAPAPTGRSGA